MKRHRFEILKIIRPKDGEACVVRKCVHCDQKTSLSEDYLKEMSYPELECPNGIEIGLLKWVAVLFGSTVNCLE